MKVYFLCNVWGKDWFLLRNDDETGASIAEFDGKEVLAGSCICYGKGCSTPYEVQVQLEKKFGKEWMSDLKIHFDSPGEVKEFREMSQAMRNVDSAGQRVQRAREELELAERELASATEDLQEKRAACGGESANIDFPNLAAMAVRTSEELNETGSAGKEKI